MAVVRNASIWKILLNHFSVKPCGGKVRKGVSLTAAPRMMNKGAIKIRKMSDAIAISAG